MAQAGHAALTVDAAMAAEAAAPETVVAWCFAAEVGAATARPRRLHQMHRQLVEQTAIGHARLCRRRLRGLCGQATGVTAAAASCGLVLLHHAADAADQRVVGQAQAGVAITAQCTDLLCDHIAVSELQDPKQWMQCRRLL
ncbi:hypothetical protein SRABI81_04109 [Stenotrophomonas lactitubi]|nr:hypothetical protein SRABI81_04109 [Stenotrophomonas lactitubi]CAH0289187.1 hypothetical protein SRABI122_04151 [Stenotrophomonas lactitubi]